MLPSAVTKIQKISITVFCYIVTIQFVAAESKELLIERYMSAFNQHDISAMIALTEPDIRWMSIDNHQLSIETVGQQSLTEALQSYFTQVPTARSKIRSIRSDGPFVYVIEQAFWKSEHGSEPQCSPTVYQINQHKIINVWYFNAYSCQ